MSKTQRGRTMIRRPQTSKKHTMALAYERGIQAVRRPLAAEDHGLFKYILDELNPEIKNASRLFEVESISVTVVGFSRYDKRHQGHGPSTSGVAEAVPSIRRPVEANLGKLGIYGSGNKHKLGFGLVSSGLSNEALALEDAFGELGFPLRKDPNVEDDRSYNLHCSVALMHNDNIGHFSDPATLERLNKIGAVQEALGHVISFDPPALKGN